MEICRCHLVPKDIATMKVVSHSFPEGTTFRFEGGTFHRGGDEDVPCHYLIAEHGDENLQLEKGVAGVNRYVAILRFDGSYRLFSTSSTMYGGYIHDEEGINYWMLDPKSGETMYCWGSGIKRQMLRVSLGQWGQIDAVVGGWHAYEYVVRYWEHLRETEGLELSPPSRTGWDERDLRLVCDLVTMRLRQLEGGGAREVGE